MQAKRRATRRGPGERQTIGALIAGGLVLIAAAASVESASIDDVRLPPNLASDTPMFHPILANMWKASSTFRRQCARIAAADQLTVKLFADVPRGRSSAPARTIITHRDGRPRTADVYLRAGANTVRLIAHEMEHIIELLDGVDLGAQSGSGSVWKHSGGFETIRAVKMGRRVEREVMAASLAGRPHDGSIDAPAATGAELMTVVQQNDRSVEHDPRAARLSADGRYVAFESFAQLVAADRNRLRDVYVIDLWTRKVTLESQGSNDTPADGESVMPDISNEGRFVVFESVAGNLLDRPVASGISRVYLRDRVTGMIRLISVAPTDRYSGSSAISADGTTVVFASGAANLPGECQSPGRRRSGLYLIRLSNGACAPVDVSSAGIRQDQESVTPSVSGDGRYVAFMSKADLTCSDRAGCPSTVADRNGLADIYVRDFEANLTVRVSRGQLGRDSDGPSYQPSISTDGQFVVFVSEASNLVAGARRSVPQVYIHDLASGTTELVSQTPRGRPANGASLWPAVARDGLAIAFQSRASDLVCALDCPAGERDINLLSDVFMYDRRTGRSIRVSAGAGEPWMEYSRAPSLDDSGRIVAFASPHPIGERDQAHDEDLYVALTAKPVSNGGVPGPPVLDVPFPPSSKASFTTIPTSNSQTSQYNAFLGVGSWRLDVDTCFFITLPVSVVCSITASQLYPCRDVDVRRALSTRSRRSEDEYRSVP